LLACVCGTSCSCVVKLGGMLSTSSYGPGAKKAFELAGSWATTNGKAYSLDMTGVADYDATTMAEHIGNQTKAGGVHAIICPYTSGTSKKCVDAVDANFSGPILVWGGAADEIFTSNCAGKNCFGTFTPGSKYMSAGIDAVDSKSDTALTVLTIVNNNAFSASVMTGASADITALGSGKMSVSDAVTLSVQGSAPSAIDQAAINAALDKKPDIVIISGHDGDVQPTVELVAAHNHTPHAILATNSLGTYTAAQYKKCVVMPTQWDSTSTTTDPVIGWDSAAFIQAITNAGLTATYHVASAGGAAVGLVNALDGLNASTQCTGADIATKLKALDIASFYGKLKWDSNGAIEKPMYMVQSTTSNYVTKSTLAWPLSSSSCWNTGAMDSTSDAATTALSNLVLGLVALLALIA